jgi:hypothetical protein
VMRQNNSEEKAGYWWELASGKFRLTSHVRDSGTQGSLVWNRLVTSLEHIMAFTTTRHECFFRVKAASNHLLTSASKTRLILDIKRQK